METIAIEEYKASVFGNAPTAAAPVEPTPADIPTITPVAAPITETAPASTTAAPAPPPVADTPVVPVVTRVEDTPAVSDPSIEYLKKFGFDSEDALRAAIAKPAAPVEPTFANDQSKKMYELLRQGKSAEVHQYLDAQTRLGNLDTLNADDKIKLHIQMQYPGYSKEDVDAEFAEKYSVNADDFIDDPQKLRRETLKMEARKADDLNKAASFFTQYQSKIELPEISPSAPAKDEAYAMWQKAQAESAQASQASADAYAKLAPQAIQSKYRFNDEASKLDFTVAFEPDAESFTKTIELLSDAEKLAATYNNPDGSPDHQRFAKDIYNGRNIDKIVSAAISQTVTSVQKWFLANQKNISDSGQRDYNVPAPTDVDKMRQQIFGRQVA